MPETAEIALHVYLTFAGNCKEAMTFYHKCLGGTLSFVALDELPDTAQLPETHRHYVLLAQLKQSLITLMATDIVPDEGLVTGNAVSLYLNCNSLQHMQQLYTALSHNGSQSSPVHQTHFGEWFGNLTDQFGIHWLLYFTP